MRPPRSGGKMADGRFRTTRKYIAPDGLEVSKTFVARKGESNKSVIQRADTWQVESRGKIPSPNMTLRLALEVWLEHRDAKLSERTKDDYRFAIEKLGDMQDRQISKIDTYAVEKALQPWGDTRTAKKMRDTGRNLFNWLRRMKWAESNPFADAEPVSYEPPMFEEGLTRDKVLAIIEFARPAQVKAMFLFLAETGRRPEVARLLMWSDLDARPDGLWCLKGNKTARGRLAVPVPAHVATEIAALPRDSMFVFPVSKGKTKGGPYSEEGLHVRWKQACRDAGIECGGIYSLRHFYASELRRRGVIGNERARLMGHSKAETAMFYDTFTSAELREIADGK